jgi:hypothetical protein
MQPAVTSVWLYGVWLYVLGPIIGGLGALLHGRTIAKTEAPS